MEKYGVALDDELAEYVEKTKRGPEDRSNRIREMMRLGFVAEQAMANAQWYPMDIQERVAMVDEAMEEYIQRNRG